MFKTFKTNRITNIFISLHAEGINPFNIGISKKSPCWAIRFGLPFKKNLEFQGQQLNLKEFDIDRNKLFTGV